MANTILSQLPPNLETLAHNVRQLITVADNNGWAMDDGNVVDYIADNISRASLSDIRTALVVAGYSARFPKATRARR
jgi:hypothetical protein